MSDFSLALSNLNYNYVSLLAESIFFLFGLKVTDGNFFLKISGRPHMEFIMNSYTEAIFFLEETDEIQFPQKDIFNKDETKLLLPTLKFKSTGKFNYSIYRRRPNILLQFPLENLTSFIHEIPYSKKYHQYLFISKTGDLILFSAKIKEITVESASCNIFFKYEGTKRQILLTK